MQQFRKMQPRKVFLIVVNFVIIGGMLLSSFAQFVRASEDVSYAEPQAPSGQGLTTLSPERPFTIFANKDMQELAVQQAMGTAVIPDFSMEDGLMRVEPLDNSTNINFPTVGSSVPQMPNPLPDMNFIPSGKGVEAFGEMSNDDTLTEELPFAEIDNGGKRPLWATLNLNPLSLITSLYTSESNSPQPPPAETSSWAFTPPDSSATAPQKPGSVSGTQIFLPIIMQPGTEPSDEIVVYPDKKGVLISTDGLIRAEVPVGAYNEPFILRYTPAQELTGGYWSLDAAIDVQINIWNFYVRSRGFSLMLLRNDF